MKTLDRILIIRATEQTRAKGTDLYERHGLSDLPDASHFPHRNPGRCRICNTPIVQARRGRTRIICTSDECQIVRQRINSRA